VVAQCALQHLELVHDACVLVLKRLQLIGNLGAGSTRSTRLRLRRALVVDGAETINLPTQRRGLPLSLGACRRLLLQSAVLLEKRATRLFRRPEVAASRLLEIDEPLASGATTDVTRGCHGHRFDGKRRKRKRLVGAVALCDQLVEEHPRSPRARSRRLGRRLLRRPVAI